jgi:hypothetical protein
MRTWHPSNVAPLLGGGELAISRLAFGTNDTYGTPRCALGEWHTSRTVCQVRLLRHLEVTSRIRKDALDSSELQPDVNRWTTQQQ